MFPGTWEIGAFSARVVSKELIRTLHRSSPIMTGRCKALKRHFRPAPAGLAICTLLVAFVAPSVAGATTFRSGVTRTASEHDAAVTRILAGVAPVFTWPKLGQGAVAVRGVGLVGSSPDERPVPIASLTKIMTTLVVLHDHPLLPGEPGPIFTITPNEVADYVNEVSFGDSTVRVAVGEKLSEFQLLEALLVPSGDNIADLLATWDAGNIARFTVKMNAMVRRLGLLSTHYGDASGVSPSSVSTAADQARLAATLMGSAVVRSIVRRHHITLPVAGTISNYNPALGDDGIIGVKSGWTNEAKSCLVTAAYKRVHGRGALVVSVALGQTGGLSAPASDDEALLSTAAGDLFAHHFIGYRTVLSSPDNPARRRHLVPIAPSVAVVWPGLVVSERVTRDAGVTPISLARARAGTLVGRFIVRGPWGIIESIPLEIENAS